jgi:hypothetical protein
MIRGIYFHTFANSNPKQIKTDSEKEQTIFIGLTLKNDSFIEFVLVFFK